MNVFMFNHSGSLNRGCEAIVKGTVNVINYCNDENDYILSSYAPEEDLALKRLMKVVPFRPGPLNKAQHAVAALNIKIRSDERYSVIKRYSDFFRDSEKADICLSVGGDTYCYGDNTAIRILTVELKRRGKKIVLWGASIGAEDLTPEKQENLACFDAIFARESLTYNLIKNKKINDKVFLFPDPAFTLTGEELLLPVSWQENNTVGINLSPLVIQKNPQLYAAVSAFIKYILDNTVMSVALVPHVTSPANNDMTVLESLYKDNRNGAKDRVFILPTDLSAEQYKGYIARLRFFIGARTHATIAAYSCGVPVIVLGYSTKSKGIAIDLFGSDASVLDAHAIQSSEPLTAAFESMRAQEQQIKSGLASRMPGVIESSFDAGKKLLSL